MACNGNCASCSGCSRALELTPAEIAFLRTLSQYAFLPVGRTLGDLTPIDPEARDREAAALLLQCLEKKGLISLDYDKPLKGFTSQAYESCPIRGSMALTQRGQLVLELMEYQGIQQ